MKKMLCVMLALIMSASLFTACGGEKEIESEVGNEADADTGNNKEPDRINMGPVYTYNEVPDISDIPLVEFTAEANGTENSSMFAATVDEEYRQIYGELVNIVDVPELFGHNEICKGDRLKIVPERIEATTPITVHIKSAKIISQSPHHFSDKYGNKEFYAAGYGYDAFVIPAVQEPNLPSYLPSAEMIRENRYRYDHVDRDFTYEMRVYEIKDGLIYMSSAFNFDYRYALVDPPNAENLAVGDFVTVSYEGHYWWYGSNDSLQIIYGKDIIEMSVLTENEIWQMFVDRNTREGSDSNVVDKPVIYLYPEEDTECSVKVTLTNGKLTCTYPEHGTEGWQNFTATPDGTLIFPDGKQYYCLYWEGKSCIDADFSKGACVKGSETAAFLEKALAEMGLSEREANEFIIYWLPILQENPYNLISFQTEAYTSVAELEITPTPDSLLRVYMTAKPMESYVEIEPQTFKGFERKGFTVVEWGGSVLK